MLLLNFFNDDDSSAVTSVGHGVFGKMSEKLRRKIHNSSLHNSPGSIMLNIKTNSLSKEGVNVQFPTCPRIKS
jgi:hypothetical protein